MHFKSKRSASLALAVTLSLFASGGAFSLETGRDGPGAIYHTSSTQTVLTSVESIRAAQMVLRDRGYYNGPINGVLNNQTRTAIRQFQRDRDLAVTGDLDLNTARALGIASSSGEQAVLVEIDEPRAERIGRDSIRVSVVARLRSGGWQVFADNFISGNTLHVYVRGIPPRGPSTQAMTEQRVTATIDNARGVSIVIFHGARRDITVQVSGAGGGGSIGVNNSRRILTITNRLLSAYQRQLNLRGTRTNIIFDSRNDLGAAETELLFNFYSLQAAAELFNRMASSVNDTDALTGAVEALVRNARLAHRTMRRNEGRLRLSSGVRSDWEHLRTELARIDPNYGNFDVDIDN